MNSHIVLLWYLVIESDTEFQVLLKECDIWPICNYLQELIEKLNTGELPKNDFPCMNDPSPTFHGTSQGATTRVGQPPAPHSMRSRRTATWAKPRASDDGYSRYGCQTFFVLKHLICLTFNLQACCSPPKVWLSATVNSHLSYSLSVSSAFFICSCDNNQWLAQS